MNTPQSLNNEQPVDTDQKPQFLADLQGNILNGHGRDYSVHIFVRFPRRNPQDQKLPKTRAAIRKWISDFAKTWITSAQKQLEDSTAFHKSQCSRKKAEDEKKPEDQIPALFDGGVFAHLAFAAPAYAPEERGGLGLGTMPKPNDPPGQFGAPVTDVFAQGLKSRAEALFDPPLGEWEQGYRGDADALIILADDLPNRMILVETETVQSLRALGATILQVERGHTLWKKFERKRRGEAEHGIPVEHFGYADGVSQPVFTKRQQEEDKKKNPRFKKFNPVNPEEEKTLWESFAPLELVLVQDPNGSNADSFGSYLVFRKLEQNVRGFKSAERELAKRLNVAKELAGAMAVGRFEDGTALVQEPGDKSDRVTNNFNYNGDPAGVTCPFHAHVRKSNPRLESVKEGGPFAQNSETELGHRIARRGVPYGGVINESENLEELPTGGVGLLFMCYQSNIENQFEFIQRFWCNNPAFLEPTLGGPGAIQYASGVGIDAVIGQRRTGLIDPVVDQPAVAPQNWPSGWGKPTTKIDCPVFAEFVKLKGGEYFFSPSISFLTGLSGTGQQQASTTSVTEAESLA